MPDESLDEFASRNPESWRRIACARDDELQDIMLNILADASDHRTEAEPAAVSN